MSTHRPKARFHLACTLIVVAGCSGPYLRTGDDLIGDLASQDPNIAALAALEVAASEDGALQAGALETLCGLLSHRDALVRSAATLALRRITGAATDYQPYREPADQAPEIRQWHDLVARFQEGSR